MNANISRTLLGFPFIILFLIFCGEKNPTKSEDVGYVEWTVSGDVFDSYKSVYCDWGKSTDGYGLVGTAYDGDHTIFVSVFWKKNPDLIVSFPYTDNAGCGFLGPETSQQYATVGYSGKITITNYNKNKRISGTFSFRAGTLSLKRWINISGNFYSVDYK